MLKGRNGQWVDYRNRIKYKYLSSATSETCEIKIFYSFSRVICAHSAIFTLSELSLKQCVLMRGGTISRLTSGQCLEISSAGKLSMMMQCLEIKTRTTNAFCFYSNVYLKFLEASNRRFMLSSTIWSHFQAGFVPIDLNSCLINNCLERNHTRFEVAVAPSCTSMLYSDWPSRESVLESSKSSRMCKLIISLMLNSCRGKFAPHCISYISCMNDT